MQAMRDTNWKDIAELTGIAAIVASLIFVGLQLKQSHEIALAAQYQSRAEASMNQSLARLESDVPNPEYFRRTGEQMTPKDLRARHIMTQWSWTLFDNNHFQYEAGFLTEEAWVALQGHIRDAYAVCEDRYIFDVRKRYLRSSFVEFVESEGDPCVHEN